MGGDKAKVLAIRPDAVCKKDSSKTAGLRYYVQSNGKEISRGPTPNNAWGIAYSRLTKNSQ